jgi:UDP:flavonoid glycosyltransferase YjiC (YdhE family)
LDRRSASDIATALQQLLKEAQFKDAASRVAGEIGAMPAPADHVTTIEALAHRSS